MSDTFSEKSTFFQKFSTSLKYSIYLQKLKNHKIKIDSKNLAKLPEIATRKISLFSYFLPSCVLVLLVFAQLAGKVEIFLQKKVILFGQLLLHQTSRRVLVKTNINF